MAQIEHSKLQKLIEDHQKLHEDMDKDLAAHSTAMHDLHEKLAAEKKLTAQLRKEAEQRETVLKAVQQVRSAYYGYIFLPDETIVFGNIVR